MANCAIFELIRISLFVIFSAVISEGDTDNQSFTQGAMKIRAFADKTVAKKRKLLAEQLDTPVEELFLESLDKVRTASPTNAGKQKSVVPMIPKISRKREPNSELSKAAAQKIPKSIEETTIDQPQDVEHNK